MHLLKQELLAELGAEFDEGDFETFFAQWSFVRPSLSVGSGTRLQQRCEWLFPWLSVTATPGGVAYGSEWLHQGTLAAYGRYRQCRQVP